MRTTGKFMNVFRKQADSSWKYAQAIFNFDKPLGSQTGSVDDPARQH
jgi:hypothetical protein